MADQLSQCIARLCVTAGMLMEDLSPDAVSSLSSDQADRSAKLGKLRQAGTDIAELLATAEVLDRRGWEMS